MMKIRKARSRRRTSLRTTFRLVFDLTCKQSPSISLSLTDSLELPTSLNVEKKSESELHKKQIVSDKVEGEVEFVVIATRICEPDPFD